MLAISTATLLSVLALASSLTCVVQANGPQLQCTEMSDIVEGDNCDSKAAEYGLTKSELQSMNPTTDCNQPLPLIGRLCVKMQKPNCTRNATATDTTCNALAAQWELTPILFVGYNDNVNDDCTNLVIGQSYCVSVT